MSEATDHGRRILDEVRSRRQEYVELVSDLCRIESPTDRPETQEAMHAALSEVLVDLGFEIRIVPGRRSGNHLLAVPSGRRSGTPAQLLMGHSDTVWPLGTLDRMPVVVEDGRLRGPGTLDMKGGVALAVIALRALRALDMKPPLDPVIFVNADEEVGSPDSKKHVRRLARACGRALVLEPALGEEGLIKTARKGIGNFEITIRGRAAHAGLDPGSGASAIVELASVIRRLMTLNDPDNGTTVNVGVVRGGTRPNVIAAEAAASVDVRITSMERGRVIEEAIHGLVPETPGVTLQVDGGMRIAPLERTPRNVALWERARACGSELGMTLDHALAGGGSDGNTTSLFTATLDGLGCVGDGAHADHEHIRIDPTLDRGALLALLLMEPTTDAP